MGYRLQRSSKSVSARDVRLSCDTPVPAGGPHASRNHGAENKHGSPSPHSELLRVWAPSLRLTASASDGPAALTATAAPRTLWLLVSRTERPEEERPDHQEEVCDDGDEGCAGFWQHMDNVAASPKRVFSCVKRQKQAALTLGPGDQQTWRTSVAEAGVWGPVFAERSTRCLPAVTWKVRKQ